MQVEWYGQSAFRLSAGDTTVVIDPFGDISAVAGASGLQWDYPPIASVRADVLLVTHEHHDHNAVETIEGEPVVLRSTAGRLDSPIGEVIGVASEHDEQAGTERGPNTIFVFELDGTRVAHFGDFGQSVLREEQARAIGPVDLLIVPVGGGPTIGGRGSEGDRRAVAAAVGGADALPHAADRLPRDRRCLPRGQSPRAKAREQQLRHRRAAGRAGPARHRP